MAPVERTGVLVLRVWVETEGDGLRGRVIHEKRLGSGDRVSVAAASVEEILAIVGRFLSDFVTGSDPRS